MSYGGVVAASLGSTGFFAVATALKHRSAAEMPRVRRFAARDLLRFVAATAAHPLWLGGLLADVGGLGLQVLALHIGALAVVQPLLATSVILAIVVNHQFAGSRMTRRELALSVVLVGALVGFLAASGAASAGAHPQPADRVPAAVAAVTAAVVAAGCVGTSRKMSSGTGAAVMGVAVGTVYAGTATLIKACTNVAQHGLLAVLSSWQLYALVAAGALGLVLAQLAFQAGPLTASLPATATIDPLASVVLGVVVYDEQLHTGAVSVVLQVAFLLLMSLAVVLLTRIKVDPRASPTARVGGR